MPGIAFRVYGDPVTQGSMRRFPSGGITHSNRKLMPWRNNVGWEAKAVWEEGPSLGAIKINCMFKIKRPKLHYGTGKNVATLKDFAPMRHIQVPDTDKLVRAILDALTGIIYKDDGQVDDIHATKQWCELGESPGVVVIIEIEEGSETCQQE